MLKKTEAHLILERLAEKGILSKKVSKEISEDIDSFLKKERKNISVNNKTIKGKKS